ncbi:MAG: peptidylprolyl isomerase [Oscillospiraceae bacterium]|nr:peptidylprolyl isomerase [Oscillospiraceae bacterium]
MNRKHLKPLMLALALALVFSACSGEGEAQTGDEGSLPAQLRTPAEGATIAVFETSLGSFSALIFESEAPLAAENFISLANSGYYNGLSFHSVAENFVAKTGDPSGTGRGGQSVWGEPFKNEYSQQLHHYIGALGMANSAENQNGSQFYFVTGEAVSAEALEEMRSLGYSEEVVSAYESEGGQPGLDYKYTVFGQVYEGLEVLEKINKVNTDASDKPRREITLISLTISSYSAPVEGEEA